MASGAGSVDSSRALVSLHEAVPVQEVDQDVLEAEREQFKNNSKVGAFFHQMTTENLTKIAFRGLRSIGNVKSDDFANALARRPLQYVCFKGIELYETTIAVVRMLGENKTIKTLHLSRVGFGFWSDNSPEKSAELGEAFSSALSRNRTLTHLNLNHDNWGTEAIQGLAQALRTMPWKDGEGKEGAVSCSRLRIMSMTESYIGWGASYLGSALESNDTLEFLSLQNCRFEYGKPPKDCQRFLKSFSGGLSLNRTLKTLNISDMAFGSFGALAPGVEHNSTLTSLYLCNKCGSIGPNSRFLSALEINTSLTSLDYPRVKDVVDEELSAIIKRNKALAAPKEAAEETDLSSPQEIEER